MQYNESNYQRFMRWLKIWLIVALIAIVIYLIYKAVAKKEDNTQHDSDNTKDDDKSIVLAAIDSIEKGVRAVVILDGSIQNACLLELFTDHGVGTLIR